MILMMLIQGPYFENCWSMLNVSNSQFLTVNYGYVSGNTQVRSLETELLRLIEVYSLLPLCFINIIFLRIFFCHIISSLKDGC